ncbi:MAG TPA: caspase family protein [Chitinophagaceae bacterium]|nr:caspase family protein [Chitinophagaceae bacterium]
MTRDGKYLLSQSFNDVNAKVWDTRTGKLIRDIPMEEGAEFMKLSPNGDDLFLNGNDSTVIVSLSTGIRRLTLKENIDRASYSNDGSRLLIQKQNEIRLLDARTLNILYRHIFPHPVINVFYLNNDKQVIAKIENNGHPDFFIMNSDLQNLKEIRYPGIAAEAYFTEFRDSLYMIRFDHKDSYIHQFDFDSVILRKTIRIDSIGSPPVCISVDRKNGNLVAGLSDSTLHLFNLKSGWIYSFDKFELGIENVEFIDSGKYFLAKNSHEALYINTSEGNSVQYFTYDDESRDLKNTGGSIVVNHQHGKFYFVLADNIIREYKIRGDTCELSQTFSGQTQNVIVASINEKDMMIADGQGYIKRMDLPKAEIVSSLNAHKDMIGDMGWAKKKGYTVTGSWDSTLKIWNLASKQLRRKISFKLPVLTAQVHDSSNLVLAIATDLIFDYDQPTSVMQTYNIETGARLQAITTHQRINSAYFSNNGKQIFYCNQSDSTVTISDLELKTIGRLKATGWIFEARESLSGKYIVAITNISVDLFDAKTYHRILSFDNDNRRGYHRASLSADEKLLVAGSGRGFISLWNAGTGELLYKVKVHSSGVIPGFINSSELITCSEDGTIKYWRYTEKGLTLIYQTVPFKASEYITTIPTGYYKGSRDAASRLHYVTSDLKIISFEQLDVKYNRPDKVLEAIRNKDTVLINSYRKAYLKRIKKLGIDTSSFKEGFTIPEADFTNRDSIGQEQKKKQLTLQIGGASTVDLDRLNVWINEVPVYGQKGISLRTKKQKNIDTTLSVILSEGDNRVETSVTDINGIESYRQPLQVKYLPARQAVPKTYFIGIGINHFADKENDLSWSVKDIRDLSKKFSKKGALVDTLFDQNVTRENIIALKNKLALTDEEDKVIIAYSGHGLLSKEYDYYLSTYAINFSKPEQNGLPYEELENLLGDIKARRKLLLIDACHSGEVDKEEMTQYQAATAALTKKGTKGGKLTYTGNNQVGMTNSFELMQELFVNVSRGTGATIISAAGGTQFAQEKGTLQNGVFTYCLLEGMNTSKHIRISELKKIVTEKVPQLTNGLQKPTFRNETQQYDWELW